MPGRLGDDPLTRKRPHSAKDAPSARPGLPAQQTSHNDVFFRRREEGPQTKPEDTPGKESGLAETVSIDEKPEITEVADIMRTAKVAEITQGAEQLANPVPIDESVRPLAEEPVVTMEPTPPAVPEPVASLEPPPPPEEPAAAPTNQPDEQPQKSEGLFKRLFGRFGK